MRGTPPGSIRIIAGAKKGRRIRVAPVGTLRPTREMVREAIFDIVGPVDGLAVLDLFAGTGAMGLEALSRGARACVFVEQDPTNTRILHKNISLLEYDDASRVMAMGYLAACAALGRTGERFDLLFVDPPYRMLQEVEVMLTPRLPSLVHPRGIVVVEGGRSSQVTFGGTCLRERVYGDTKVTIIENEED